MSTSTATETKPVEVAAKAPAKRTRKAPAKPQPTVDVVDHNDGTTADELDAKTVFVYEATGRAGVTNRRTFPNQMVVAADVQDESHPSPRWKQGVITRFFATQTQAEKYADRQRETGCDVVLVPATLVEEKQA